MSCFRTRFYFSTTKNVQAYSTMCTSLSRLSQDLLKQFYTTVSTTFCPQHLSKGGRFLCGFTQTFQAVQTKPTKCHQGASHIPFLTGNFQPGNTSLDPLEHPLGYYQILTMSGNYNMHECMCVSCLYAGQHPLLKIYPSTHDY